MTIIEFYDKNAIENIAGAMMCQPEKVILIGNDQREMAERSEAYLNVLRENSINTEILYTVIDKTNLSDVVKKIGNIVENYEDCIFDLTGGDELYLVAVGIIMERYTDKVKCHRFNFANDKIVDCDSDGNVAEVKSFDISVENNIAIYGGNMVSDSNTESYSFDWKFDDEFISDVEKLWDICKSNPGNWNSQVGVIGSICNAFGNEESLYLSYAPERVIAELGGGKDRYRIQDWFLDKLSEDGLINSLVKDDDISFRFKNKHIKRCLTVAGQVLELFVTAKLRGILDRERKPLYNDVRAGVVINWDDEHSKSEPTVVNEIDVFAMKGAIPVFISCKNGFVGVDELYKLNTVAERFGGKYARKVLVTSNFVDTKGKQEYFGARMREMDIVHINNLAKMSDADFNKLLSTLWKEI